MIEFSSHNMRHGVSALVGAGFELIGIFSDFGFSEINDTDERWYIAARAKK